jgi:NADPH:quinone reductase-like Zn-dependent oxidoreductase
VVAVDDSDVTHLPDGVDLADAAAIPLVALTGDSIACVTFERVEV